MERFRAALIATLVAALMGLGASSTASAQRRGSAGATTEVEGEVLIVLATEAEGPVDERLRSVRALRRPPFSAYHSMSLLGSPQIRLRVGQPHELELPNGRRMRIVLREVTERGRFRLQISVNRPGERDYLPEVTVVSSPGDPFFIAGQSYRDGTLVIGIRLGERP